MIVSERRYFVECDRCHNQSVGDAEFAVDAALDAGGCGWKRTDINRWMCPRCVRDVAQLRAQIAAHGILLTRCDCGGEA